MNIFIIKILRRCYDAFKKGRKNTLYFYDNSTTPIVVVNKTNSDDNIVRGEIFNKKSSQSVKTKHHRMFMNNRG